MTIHQCGGSGTLRSQRYAMPLGFGNKAGSFALASYLGTAMGDFVDYNLRLMVGGKGRQSMDYEKYKRVRNSGWSC